MRSRLAARSAQVFLTAAVSATALTAAATGTAFAGTSEHGEGAAHAAQKDPALKDVGQFCGTNDLTFSLTEETQAGGYYLVTAKAKPGITCYLEGIAPTASFGSTPETQVSPSEPPAAYTSIEVSDSLPAYTGISPKSVGTNEGTDSQALSLDITGHETRPVTLGLPETVSVNQPIATNWQADSADAVPFPS